MRKLLVSLVLVGASALYVFARMPDDDAPTMVVSGGLEATTTPSVTPASSGTSAMPASSSPPPQASSASGLKDGSYTGTSVDAYYGFVQVKATISGGALTDVTFLSYPNDRGTSREINSQAMPALIQEAIAAQNANVDIVSGATQTSEAFRQSLASALAQAGG